MSEEIKWMILNPTSGQPVYQSDLGKPNAERGMELDQALAWSESLLSETVLVPAFLYWGFQNPEACETCGQMFEGDTCPCEESS